jgi:hypothetical protein
MTTYIAADGNTYKTITASGVSRSLANRGLDRLVWLWGSGFSVYTDADGTVVVDHFSSPDVEAGFFETLDSLGYVYNVEANSIGNYRDKQIRVEAARITARKAA